MGENLAERGSLATVGSH